ncbi:Protein decapentaplegic [Orchesella cincta]|uniref:Protein decapentaplegic n=1 Tax=Orchesella cincta TaxID=48709 RepID=A0A1D2MSM9_ORCCI|nr:Protein decapentaplegic [Orchesella cincta]
MLRLGVPLLASVVVFQTGCLYLTVFADLHSDSLQRPFQINQPVISYKPGESSHGKVEYGKHGIYIHDFSSMASSQVVMEVKDSGVVTTDQETTESQAEDDNVEESSSSSNQFTTQDLKQLENRFLNLFGMKKRPEESGEKKVIPKEVLELYERQTSSEFPTTDLFLPGKLTRNANTVRTFGPMGYSRIAIPQHSILSFDLTSIPKIEKVMGAELRVPFSITINKTNPSLDYSPSPIFVRVLAHDIVKPPKVSRSKETYRHTEAITYATDSKLVNLTNRKRSTFWLTFDVFPAVSRWMLSSNQTKSNHGISIQMMGLNGEPYETIDDAIKFNMEIKQADAMLFVYSDDGHDEKRRSKRDAKTISRKYRNAQQQYYQHQARRARRPHKHKNRRRNLCSKKPMFVDFTDVGWNDWIVAPPGYQAFFCSGECPFPMAEHLNATNHAVIQALINSMNPALVPPPCCVPNKYSSLSLLYTDSSDRIVLKNYNEMVVDSCGCN